jgi:hypothetical protein
MSGQTGLIARFPAVAELTYLRAMPGHSGQKWVKNALAKPGQSGQKLGNDCRSLARANGRHATAQARAETMPGQRLPDAGQ